MIWSGILEKAERDKEFSIQDANLARSFFTCAVSDHPDFKSTENLNNLTPKMMELGSDFYAAVVCDEIKKAKKTYQKILKVKRIWN